MHWQAAARMLPATGVTYAEQDEAEVDMVADSQTPGSQNASESMDLPLAAAPVDSAAAEAAVVPGTNPATGWQAPPAADLQPSPRNIATPGAPEEAQALEQVGNGEPAVSPGQVVDLSGSPTEAAIQQPAGLGAAAAAHIGGLHGVPVAMRLPGPLQPVTRVAAAPDSGTAQALTQSQDDDGSYCSVCMEAWTNSGPHRICSLKCGHLFGRDCIVKWLKQKKRCPQCNKRNKLEDVRPLYVAKLTAVDVAPVEALKQEVAEERKARAKAEHDMAKAQQEVRKMAACVKKLQKENARMQMFAAGVQAATGQLGMAPHSGTWRGQLGAFAVVGAGGAPTAMQQPAHMPLGIWPAMPAAQHATAQSAARDQPWIPAATQTPHQPQPAVSSGVPAVSACLPARAQGPVHHGTSVPAAANVHVSEQPRASDAASRQLLDQPRVSSTSASNAHLAAPFSRQLADRVQQALQNDRQCDRSSVHVQSQQQAPDDGQQQQQHPYCLAPPLGHQLHSLQLPASTQQQPQRNPVTQPPSTQSQPSAAEPLQCLPAPQRALAAAHARQLVDGAFSRDATHEHQSRVPSWPAQPVLPLTLTQQNQQQHQQLQQQHGAAACPPPQSMQGCAQLTTSCAPPEHPLSHAHKRQRLSPGRATISHAGVPCSGYGGVAASGTGQYAHLPQAQQQAQPRTTLTSSAAQHSQPYSQQHRQAAAATEPSQPIGPAVLGGSFRTQQRLELAGRARCFEMDVATAVVLIPMSSSTGGQFVRKISMLAPTAGQNVTLPTSEPGDFVRDIHFDAPKHHALLALGKQLRLFSIRTDNVVASCRLPAAAWSCAWDALDTNLVYAGLQSGQVLAYDLRQPDQPLYTLQAAARQPVHTILSLSCPSFHASAAVATNTAATAMSHNTSTLVAACYAGVTQWQHSLTGQGLQAQAGSLICPGAGQCTSLSWHAASPSLAVSRRCVAEGTATHQLWRPAQAEASSQADMGSASCWGAMGPSISHERSLLMTRPALMPRPQSALQADSAPLLACPDEASKAVLLWDARASLGRSPAAVMGPVMLQAMSKHVTAPLQVKAGSGRLGTVVASLSERALHLHAWVPSVAVT